ncbi:hypothetical protein I4U23_003972 [Adineta vaga]|nr:hypothetical protein I4U23_003972 [Adineta vaga]
MFNIQRTFHYILITCVLILCLTYMTLVNNYNGYNHLQYQHTRKHKHISKVDLKSFLLSVQNYPNETDDCIYHDRENGLFHPTVKHPRYIITGGAGLVGSHLVKRLRQQYEADQIKVLDNLSRGRLHNLQYKDGTWAISTPRDFCLVDLRNIHLACKYITGADVIFHLANVVPNVNLSNSSYLLDNLRININTLYATQVNNISSMIYARRRSSLSTFSDKSDSSYYWYKRLKKYEDKLLRSHHFDIGIVRFQNVYGPYNDFTDTSDHIIESLIRKLLQSENNLFIIPEFGEQGRDFIYVADVVDSLMLTYEQGMNKGPIDVASGRSTSTKELTDIIRNVAKAKLGRKMKVIFEFSQVENNQEKIIDLSHANNILGWKAKVSLKEGISKTMIWMKENQHKPKILVIIIGQIRGGILAWKSLHKFFLRPFDAHLAFYISGFEIKTYLHEIAQYIWMEPEYDDWGIMFDMVAKACNNEKILGKWRNYCKLPGIYMGGVKNCSHDSHSSISYVFRWLLQQKIKKLQLLDKYDWFVLTRADELYLCQHYDFTTMIEDDVLLPTGEHYKGWSDRHLIGRSSVFMKIINITNELVCNPDYWYRKFKRNGRVYNIEQTQKFIWADMNLQVSELPRSMFIVRTQDDPASWSTGLFHPQLNHFGLKVKYPMELWSSHRHCKINNITNVLKSLRHYHGDILNDVISDYVE